MKKKITIILIIICILFVFISGIIYIRNKEKIPVLCYHNLATAEEKVNFESEKDWTIDVQNFEEQLKLLLMMDSYLIIIMLFHCLKNTI